MWTPYHSWTLGISPYQFQSKRHLREIMISTTQLGKLTIMYIAPAGMMGFNPGVLERAS
jgi:hypothetical protein